MKLHVISGHKGELFNSVRSLGTTNLPDLRKPEYELLNGEM